MNPRTSLKGGCALLCIALIGCADTSSNGASSFQSQYEFARNSLEKGNYAAANRTYMRLLSQAGPLDDRISVELSHSYLRAGDLEQAFETASTVAGRTTGSTRSAALSVQGTAEHEVALKLLSKGNTAAGAARMKAAQKSIEEVLAQHPELDPLGGLAGRQASMKVRLASMR